MDIKPAENTGVVLPVRVWSAAQRPIKTELYYDTASWTADTRIEMWLTDFFGNELGRTAYTRDTAQGGGFTVVSQGISEALVATAAGIAVAVEAVVLYNFFNQRLTRINMETRFYIEEFLEALSGEGRPVVDELPAARKEEADGSGKAAG
jgi:hypothetical protein